MTNNRHLQAVQALEEAATAVVVDALSGVLKGVADVIDSVTAATDPPPAEPRLSPDDLAHIQTGWTIAVDGEILPWYRTVFLAGADAATEQVADMREIATEIIGDSDPLLLNEAATTHLATARNRFLDIGQDTWAAARNQMLEGFAAGEGIDPIRQRLQEVVDLSKARATAVARTEVISAGNAGAIERVREMGADAPKYKQWLCVTGDTRVWSPQPSEVVKRRRPTGPLVRVIARSGDVLTVTPQHPVLTQRGWVPAHLVEQGDYLVRHRDIKTMSDQAPGASGLCGSGLGHDPYVDHSPPRIDELYRAASQRWPHGRVVTRVMDFDCGGVHCEVQVVPTDGYLLADGQSSVSQPAGHGGLVFTDVVLGDLFDSGALTERLVFYPPAMVSLLEGSGPAGYDFRRVPAGAYPAGSTSIPTNDPGLIQPTRHGLLRDVPGGGEIADAVALGVALDEIIEVNGYIESGWHDVYDLSTGCGWFVANGFIVHNSTNDSRTRLTHRAVDNTVVPLGEKFIVGAASLDYPGDPSGPDEEVINCRCAPIFVDDPEGETADDGLDLTQDVAALVASGYEPPWLSVSRGGVRFKTAEQIDSTTGEVHTGSMIALLPSEPASLAVDSGEPADQLHVTLWFLGHAEDIPPEVQEQLLSRVGYLASRMPPIEAQVFGAAVWNPTGDDPCCVLNIGGHGLEAVRSQAMMAILEASAGTGWIPAENHTPWAAHMCVGYSPDPAALMTEALTMVGPVTLDSLQLTFGGVAHDFPLQGVNGDNPEDRNDPEIESAEVTDPESADLLDTPEDTTMPFAIRRGGTDCPFEVYNSETDERVEGGCHETRQEAVDHQKALQVNVPDAAAGGDCPPGHHKMPNGECMPNQDMTALAPQAGEHFHAIMHTQGESTGFRTFNDLSWREVPFAFHWQRSSSAHGGMPETFHVGLVTRVMPDPENPEALHAWGRLDLADEMGAEYGRKLAEGFARWVSIGLDEQPVKETIIWPEDSEDADDISKLFDQPEQIIIDGGRIGELTGVSVPAQDNATIEPTPELLAALSSSDSDAEPFGAEMQAEHVEQLAAEAFILDPPEEEMSDTIADTVQALTAAAHRIEIPHVPPAAWFREPTDVDISGALYVTDDGRLYGALAPLNTGHRAFVHSGGRKEVPFGNVDYSRFMGAVAICQEGRIPAGPVTMDCGHANRYREDHDVAPAHYENSCTVVAKICVGESRDRGIVWAAGALEPGVTVDQVSRMLACRLSGDWQPHPDRPGQLELVAALLVPSPGFPMAHDGARMDYEDGVLVASSVPVRAVAGGRPRLRINAAARTVERLAPPTNAEQIAATIASVRDGR